MATLCTSSTHRGCIKSSGLSCCAGGGGSLLLLADLACLRCACMSVGLRRDDHLRDGPTAGASCVSGKAAEGTGHCYWERRAMRAGCWPHPPRGGQDCLPLIARVLTACSARFVYLGRQRRALSRSGFEHEGIWAEVRWIRYSTAVDKMESSCGHPRVARAAIARAQGVAF